MKKKLSTLSLALMFLTFANSASACVKGKLEKVLPNGKTVELTIDVLNFSTEQIEKFCADAVEPKACQDNAANTVSGFMLSDTGLLMLLLELSVETCRKSIATGPAGCAIVEVVCWLFSDWPGCK